MVVGTVKVAWCTSSSTTQKLELLVVGINQYSIKKKITKNLKNKKNNNKVFTFVIFCFSTPKSFSYLKYDRNIMKILLSVLWYSLLCTSHLMLSMNLFFFERLVLSRPVSNTMYLWNMLPYREKFGILVFLIYSAFYVPFIAFWSMLLKWLWSRHQFVCFLSWWHSFFFL